MTIILFTVIIFLIAAYFLYKPIHKYRYFIYGIAIIIALIAAEDPNIINLGYVPFGIFLLVMYSGLLEKSTIRKRLFMVRAEYAIIAGIFISVHALSFLDYLLDDYSGIFPFNAVFGILAILVALPLWVTSFVFVRKKLGYKSWKKLHQLAYIFYVSSLIHLILIRNQRMWFYISLLCIYVLFKAIDLITKRKSAV